MEGKVFSDPRVLTEASRTPEVIAQVNGYTAAIEAEKANIEARYGEHIRVVNKLFGSDFCDRVTFSDTKAKLLVYGVPLEPNVNAKSSMDKITAALGECNVAWYRANCEPTIDEIGQALCGKQ